MAGEDGTLTKENFTKILRSSDMFLKAFDKNKDGIVTEVNIVEQHWRTWEPEIQVLEKEQSLKDSLSKWNF